jgi:hypothetical protein
LNSYKLVAFRMAPRKWKSIGRVNPNSLRMKLLRAAETPQQRQVCLEQNRTRNAEARAAETTEQRESRLEKDRTTTAKLRAAETTEQREYRLEMNRTTTAKSRETETNTVGNDLRRTGSEWQKRDKLL